jgi:hypothetical protein
MFFFGQNRVPLKDNWRRPADLEGTWTNGIRSLRVSGGSGIRKGCPRHPGLQFLAALAPLACWCLDWFMGWLKEYNSTVCSFEQKL